MTLRGSTNLRQPREVSVPGRSCALILAPSRINAHYRERHQAVGVSRAILRIHFLLAWRYGTESSIQQVRLYYMYCSSKLKFIIMNINYNIVFTIQNKAGHTFTGLILYNSKTGGQSNDSHERRELHNVVNRTKVYKKTLSYNLLHKTIPIRCIL